MRATPVIRNYREFIQSFSREEMESIVQMKRLFEWAQGDVDFRTRLNKGNLSAGDLGRFKEIGIRFGFEDLDLIWREPEYFSALTQYYGKDVPNGIGPALSLDLLNRYPCIGLWLEYLDRYGNNYKSYLKEIPRVPECPAFDGWRMRRIKAVKSELGYYGHQIDNPLFAFELGKGCSVGCWFCAYSAVKFQKNFEYEENKDFFAGIVRECIRLFGREGAGYALLYSATEPHDNPRYLDFVKDFETLTGSVVCTSTAVTNDYGWIKALIDYYKNDYQPWPRLSVLSKAALFKIHESFTPMELRDVRLLMQMRDSPREKVSAGRLFSEGSRCGGPLKDRMVPQGSISCVSGFVVNLVDCSIKLVSPCYTSTKWPKGHRVYDQVFFKPEPGSFGRALEELIERNMFDSPPRDKVLAFRDDLAFLPTEEGFDLVSPNQIHHFTGGRNIREMGERLVEKRYDYSDLFAIDPVTTLSFIDILYDDGMLDEVFYGGRE